jgi:hypothetical protein
VFSDVFSEGMAALAEADGEAVLYTGPGESPKPATAIVGNESADRPLGSDVGKVTKRRREFTFQLSEVSPAINALVRYLEEDWTIVGFRSRSATAARVICTRDVITERTKREFRGGSH